MRPTLRVKVPQISAILAFALLILYVAFPTIGRLRGVLVYAFAAYMLLQLMIKRTGIRWGHTVWIFGFYLMGAFSEYWAYLPVAVRLIKTNFLMAILLSWSFGEYIFQKEKSLEDISKLMQILALVLVANFVLNTEIKNGRFYAGNNANGIGMNAAYMFGFILYTAKNHRWRNVFEDILLAVLVIVILLTGSRKSVMMIAIFVTAFFLFWSREKAGVNTVFRIIGLSAAAIAAVMLVMNVPILYDALGNRIETLYRYVVNGEQVDGSAVTRTKMLQIGMRMFLNMNPVFGSGLNNYKYLSGYLTYSHNNYMELLCSVGIVGTLLYYIPIVIFSIRAIFLWRKRVPGAIVPLTILLMQFINDAGMVSYYSSNNHILLGITIGLLDLMERRQREKEAAADEKWQEELEELDEERKEALRNEAV